MKHLSNETELSGIGRALLVAAVAGVLIGLVGAGFRAGLSWLEPRHAALVEWAQGWPWIGWVLPVVLGAVGAGLARWMVRPQPLAAGSGVQHVEAVMQGQAEPASWLVVPIKFVGGWLAIGSGLALGREGPTIQMGATIGASLAKWGRCAKEVVRDLQAALGGAGLAVAFNAPVGGAMFVFEEVARSFRLRLTLLTLVGTACAIVVSRVLLGNAPDFAAPTVADPAAWTLPVYAVFGGVLGLLGVVYNRVTIGLIEAMERLKAWPTEFRAALIGAMVGVVAWFAPGLVGGGDGMTQGVLHSGFAVGTLLVILLVRWFLGPLSYAAGTPGGIFSPLLLVGAALGWLFATGWNTLLPSDGLLSPAAFAMVGMAAFFTGVVRAPLTGVILIAEMTATANQMAPMLAAVFGAMLTASMVRGEPIYDTLRHRMLAAFPAKEVGR
jgi:chloride channel protein, CIC family